MRGRDVQDSLRRDLALMPGKEVAGFVVDELLEVFLEVGFFIERRKVANNDLLSDRSGLLEDCVAGARWFRAAAASS